jgi:hypothetical protein
MHRRAFARLAAVVVLALLALFAASGSALALDRGADGWFHTGEGVRVKTLLLLSFDVYSIGHDMKELPPARSKAAVILTDTDKRFVWRMLRDVDHEKIRKALSDAFAVNGYADASKIGPFVGAFSGDLVKGAQVTIRYDSTAKAVAVSVQGGGTATVPGFEFMKAVWSIWFGRIDQPALGDALLKNL